MIPDHEIENWEPTMGEGSYVSLEHVDGDTYSGRYQIYYCGFPYGLPLPWVQAVCRAQDLDTQREELRLEWCRMQQAAHDRATRHQTQLDAEEAVMRAEAHVLFDRMVARGQVHEKQGAA